MVAAKPPRRCRNDADAKNNAPKSDCGGSAEPRGKGAAATVRKRMIDEILFDGGSFCAFVTFPAGEFKPTLDKGQQKYSPPNIPFGS